VVNCCVGFQFRSGFRSRVLDVSFVLWPITCGFTGRRTFVRVLWLGVGNNRRTVYSARLQMPKHVIGSPQGSGRPQLWYVACTTTAARYNASVSSKFRFVPWNFALRNLPRDTNVSELPMPEGTRGQGRNFGQARHRRFASTPPTERTRKSTPKLREQDWQAGALWLAKACVGHVNCSQVLRSWREGCLHGCSEGAQASLRLPNACQGGHQWLYTQSAVSAAAAAQSAAAPVGGR
jgi:hypothetical protein